MLTQTEFWPILLTLYLQAAAGIPAFVSMMTNHIYINSVLTFDDQGCVRVRMQKTPQQLLLHVVLHVFAGSRGAGSGFHNVQRSNYEHAVAPTVVSAVLHHALALGGGEHVGQHHGHCDPPPRLEGYIQNQQLVV